MIVRSKQLSTPVRSDRRPLATVGVIMMILVATVAWAGLSPTAIAAGTHTVMGNDGVTVTWSLPETIRPGEDIVITGVGWKTLDAQAGSGISILVNQPAGPAPENSPAVSTAREVISGITGQVLGDKRIHAQVRADVDGNWTAVVPYPTVENSSLEHPWRVGERHGIRILTGSAVDGDTIRSAFAAFTIAEVAGPSSTAPTTLIPPEPGPTVVIPGSSTTASMSTPTPTVIPNSTTELTTTVPTTTPTSSPTASTAAPSSFVPVSTTATSAAPNESAPPPWPHETVEVRSEDGRIAIAWIERDVEVLPGATIRLRGEGWSDQRGTRASVVAIKLNAGDGRQFTRAGTGIVNHPSASGDDTIWALLAADTAGHANVRTIEDDGSFDIEFDVPGDLEPGQHLSVTLQTGRFLESDVARSITSAPLIVGGIEWVDPGGGDRDAQACSASAAPSYTIETPTVRLGGALRLTGEGWCHPSDGGSVIAIKLDEGAYSHLHTDIHQNRTIWAIIEADPVNGSFVIDLPLPDGTDATSAPAFVEGAHSLQMLTGTLKPGDTIRTVKTESFVVGVYEPLGAPDPVEISEDLNAANQGGVSVSRQGDQLSIALPGSAGDWIFLTAFDGSSPRYVWGTAWFVADRDGRVQVPTAGLPSGRVVMTVHRDAGGGAELAGWGEVEMPVATPSTSVPPSVPAATAPPTTRPPAGVTPTTRSSAARTPRAATPTTTTRDEGSTSSVDESHASPPADTPGAPVPSSDGLDGTNRGSVAVSTEGPLVTVRLAENRAGEWVYIYLYSTPLGVGWAQTDDAAAVILDLSLMEPGDHKIAVIDAEGALLGWAPVQVPGSAAAAISGVGADATDTDGVGGLVIDSSALEASDELESPRPWYGNRLVWLLAAVAIVGFGLLLARRSRPSRKADGPEHPPVVDLDDAEEFGTYPVVHVELREPEADTMMNESV